MVGEVRQWNLDSFAPYDVILDLGPFADCAYLDAASSRVIRGSDFAGIALSLTLDRSGEAPGDVSDGTGFRCARSP
ncbi:MAG: hypothetical protein ABSC94_08255 [Polyangiaceae bacterium]